MTLSFRYLLTFTMLLILVSVNVTSAESGISEISTANEITAELSVPEIVNEGEMISFTYEISSNKDTTVRFISHIDCATGIDDFLNEETIELTAGTPYIGSHNLVTLSYEYFENGYCTAYIYLLEPEQAFSETFEIKVADHLDADTDSYAPRERWNKRVFRVGEVAEIRNKATTNTYENAVISFETTISNNGTPVGTYNTKNITLNLTEPGYYEVRVTATAGGFMLDKAVTRFTVVQNVPIAKTLQFICNSNGRCDSEIGETSGNCAWDCPSNVQLIADDPITAKLGIEQIIEPTPITQPLPIPEPTLEPTPEPTIEPILEPIPESKPLVSQEATVSPFGMSLGRAVCVFDGICATPINFAVFAIAIAVILGVAFLKFKKGVSK